MQSCIQCVANQSPRWTLNNRTHHKRAGSQLTVHLAELRVTALVVEEDVDVANDHVWQWRLGVEGPQRNDLRGIVIQVVTALLDAILPNASDLDRFLKR
jgi:hypothetical protein